MNDANILGLVELALLFGIVLGLAVWQLMQLRKDKTSRAPLSKKAEKED
jgi:hypothetical protein